VERAILALYCLVSGYALRGLRAVISLAVVVCGLAILFQRVGMTGREPSLRDSLIYTALTTLSLPSTTKSVTDNIGWAGELIRIALRLAGPLLLGLALLSVRNRVKR
jgi:hypothetical protein